MTFYSEGDLVPVGKYALKIEDQLGKGGMATVFLARRLDLNGLVVLKVLNPTLAQASKWATKSFQAEARVLAQMKSEFLPVVMDLGETTDAVQAHYYTMERIVGRSLKQVLDYQQATYGTRRVRLDQALNIASQIAQGLAAVHKRGVVHCDIKPANIFLYRTEDGATRVKIIDFGIMLVTDDRGSRPYVGTPAYSAPEQLIEETVGPAADIFPVGLILHELVAGKWAYREYGHDYLQALQRVEVEAPALTSVDDLPRALPALVARALALDPAKRPSALALANELRTIARELGPVDRSILQTDPGAFRGRASAEEDERPITVAEVHSTDVDVNLELLMQAVEKEKSRERERLALAETEPTAAPRGAVSINDTTPTAAPAFDEEHNHGQAPATRNIHTPRGRSKLRIYSTTPMPNRPRGSAELVTVPPSRELPPPASDKSGIYVPDRKGATTPVASPLAPRKKVNLTVAKAAPFGVSRRRRLWRALTSRLDRIASRRFGRLYIVALSGLLGCLLILAAYAALQAIHRPTSASNAVQRGVSP